MDASQGFKSLQDEIQAALVAATRTVNELVNEDLAFQRTVDPAVGGQLDEATSRVLRLSSELLKSAAKSAGQKAPLIEEADDIDMNWRGIVDVVDSLLEKADTCLDEYTGLIKRKDAPVTPDSVRPQKKFRKDEPLSWSLKRANIIKPQTSFERKTDNLATGPWKPVLTAKPHATVPLEQSLGYTTGDEEPIQYDYTLFLPLCPMSKGVIHNTDVSDKQKIAMEKRRHLLATSGSTWHANGTFRYKHPYEAEILHVQFPRRVYEKVEPIPYLPVETTAATWVDSYEGVLKLVEELKGAKEIAIDLEHHDYRTYPGLTSLMQISTREKDWIVDTLQPWRHKLEVLNEVFADPNIVKVLHGAHMDIIWLQRDLGLYVVGLFDTFHASSALGYPGRSLAYLLKRFIDFDADKKYQMADWRIRPLPDEMFYYARSDTHYLLNIFDHLRNELVERSDLEVPEKNLIEWVLQKSKEEALQRYENPVCDQETGDGSRGWYNLLVKSPAQYDREQFAVFRAVFKWRDDMARKYDESPPFIMGQHVLADIARLVPGDQRALWSLFSRDANIVRQNLDALFDVIQKAKAAGVNGPSMIEFFRRDTMGAVAKQVFGDLGAQKNGTGGEAVPDARELRSQRSQLWGGVPLSSVWDGSASAAKIHDKGEIAVPWTAYVQNQIGNTDVGMGGTSGAPDGKDAALPTSRETKAAAVPEEERAFTLKTGRKQRSRGINSDTGSAAENLDIDNSGSLSGEEQDHIPLDEPTQPDTAAEKKAHKAAMKAERKARRAAKRAAKQAGKRAAGEDVEEGEVDDDEEEEEEPFDYKSAQSVLHAPNANGNGAGTKVFDPYRAKTAGVQKDEIKGARNLNYQRSGRSATFKK